MSQFFDLCLANETLANDAYQLGVATEDLQRIQVQISATLIQQPQAYLQLHYHMTLPLESLAAQLDWTAWQAEQVRFSNYLWEETCLECFITGRSLDDHEASDTDNTASYIEVNANPDGRYALYQFERYRHPATLPPTPLLHADKQTCASIDWHEGSKPPLALTKPTSSIAYHYERSFRVPLKQLDLSDANSKPQYAINSTIIEYIHPCVILWFGGTALYFATSHASPPDFHDQRYWSRFIP